MPNWTDTYVHIEGDPEELAQINAANLDFQILYPCPFITAEREIEGWYEWCSTHWGTKWPARDVEVNHIPGSEVLSATFRTAWSVPHGVLAYLTLKFPSVKIIAEWADDTCDCVGESRYCEGQIVSKSIDPSLYKPAALEAFADKYLWFSYENYDSMIGRSLEEEDIKDLETNIKINTRTCTYEDFIKRVLLVE